MTTDDSDGNESKSSSDKQKNAKSKSNRTPSPLQPTLMPDSNLASLENQQLQDLRLRQDKSFEKADQNPNQNNIRSESVEQTSVT